MGISPSCGPMSLLVAATGLVSCRRIATASWRQLVRSSSSASAGTPPYSIVAASRLVEGRFRPVLVGKGAWTAKTACNPQSIDAPDVAWRHDTELLAIRLNDATFGTAPLTGVLLTRRPRLVAAIVLVATRRLGVVLTALEGRTTVIVGDRPLF